MLLGYIASVLVTIAYLPQVKSCIITKSRGVSVHTLIILLTAMGCWIGYAIIVNDMPLLVSSSISVLQLLFLLIYPHVKRRAKQLNT